MILARITRGDPANFLFFVLFMFDFSSCCCELMASNAVLLRTFLRCVRCSATLPCCPRAMPVCAPWTFCSPTLGWGDREKRGPERQNRVCVPLTRAWSTAMRGDLEKAVLESGHGAGFIKAASGGASWHSTEHKPQPGAFPPTPRAGGGNQAQSWTGVPLKSSAFPECCPTQCQHRPCVGVSSW